MIEAEVTAFHELKILTSGSVVIPSSRISHTLQRHVTKPIGSGLGYRAMGFVARKFLVGMLQLSKRIDTPDHEKQ